MQHLKDWAEFGLGSTTGPSGLVIWYSPGCEDPLSVVQNSETLATAKPRRRGCVLTRGVPRACGGRGEASAADTLEHQDRELVLAHQPQRRA